MFSSHFHHHLHLFQTLVPFFSNWGYLIIIISAFLETLPLVGIISPGGAALVLGGFLAKTHVLNFWYVLGFSMIGAYIGDAVAYIIGRIYGSHFLRSYGRFFFLKEERLEKTQKLLQDHAGKSIVIGRFSYLTRSLTPFLSGVSNIAPFKFFSFSVLSVFLWAFAHVALGFVVGQGFQAASRYINLILLSAIIISVAIFYGYRFVNKRNHIFQKYHIFTLIFNILSIYVFAKALEDVVNGEWIHTVDIAVNNFIPTIWNPVVIQIMIVVSDLFTPLNVFLFTCLFIGYLLHHHKWYYSLLVFFSITFGVLAEYFFKIITAIERPLHPLLETINSSFPSGHATIIAIFGILVFHCIRKDLKAGWQRAMLLIACIVLIFLVGFSRIYLNAHWFSDVIAGYALGVFSVTFFILFLKAVDSVWEKILKIGEAILEPFFNFKE